jgi:hypothetical protein
METDLVGFVEYSHHGYFGSRLLTYYRIDYTLVVNFALAQACEGRMVCRRYVFPIH